MRYDPLNPAHKAQVLEAAIFVTLGSFALGFGAVTAFLVWLF